MELYFTILQSSRHDEGIIMCSQGILNASCSVDGASQIVSSKKRIGLVFRMLQGQNYLVQKNTMLVALNILRHHRNRYIELEYEILHVIAAHAVSVIRPYHDSAASRIQRICRHKLLKRRRGSGNDYGYNQGNESKTNNLR